MQSRVCARLAPMAVGRGRHQLARPTSVRRRCASRARWPGDDLVEGHDGAGAHSTSSYRAPLGDGVRRFRSQAGPTGAHFGILACLFTELIQSWQMIQSPSTSLLKLLACVVLLFGIGVLPWIDNYAHLFGFLRGLFLSMALVPYITFGSRDGHRKFAGTVISLLLAAAMLTLLILLFYVVPIYECDGCSYFTCIPFTDTICSSMKVEVKRPPR